MTTSATAIQACNVLLIGDDPSDARLVKHALNQVDNPGYCLEHVTQLSTALERINSGGLDVALLDLALLDSSGPETFQAMSAAACRVPIVAYASYDGEPRVARILQIGAQDYLIKRDISPTVLARSLRYAIERRRAALLESLNHKLEQVKSSLTKAVGELELANADLAHFSIFASHDLQEPVRKINFFAAQLQEHLGSQMNEDVRKDFHFIVDAGRRMQALIVSLLALSKVSHAELEWAPVDLEQCVDEVVNDLAARIAETRTVLVRDSLPRVTGNSTLLKQLYLNLIENAIKFNAGQSPVIHLTAERNGEQWVLGVRDNGIGIKPQHAQVIFTPFQRLNRRDRFAGAGIGLTICQKVVQRHGGRIWVESKLGAGAHFKFLLAADGDTNPLAGDAVPGRALAEEPQRSVSKWFNDRPTTGIKSPSQRIRLAFQESLYA